MAGLMATSGTYNSFRTRNTHRPEEKDGEFADEPLGEAHIVQKLYKSNEKNNRW